MDIKIRTSENRKTFFGEDYKEESEFVTKTKLHCGKFLIGRMLSLCKNSEKGHIHVSRFDASLIVAKELRNDWVQKNVYPIGEHAIAKKIKAEYETFKELRKSENNKTKQKGIKWMEKAKLFNERMTNNAYDKRCRDNMYEKQMEEQYGVKMTSEDIEFYEDNCFGNYSYRCSYTIPRNWLKQKNRLEKRAKSAQIMIDTPKEHEAANNSAVICDIHDDDETDTDFIPPSDIYFPATPNTEMSTRSKTVHRESSSTTSSHTFPSVKIRTGNKTISESLMRCIIQCLSQYKVTTNDLIGIVVQLANTVFGQTWSVHSPESDDDGGDLSSDEETDECDSNSKRKLCCKDKSFVMPSRHCIMNYLEDASFMNLEMVAQYILNKDETESVVTVGLDDTTKAAGHKLFDVKSDHLTIAGPNHERKSFTTGYIENVSHSGKDGARAYGMKLQCLATLSNSTVDEIKSHIDFWICDRASDCKVLLENLDITSEKTLKCTAHVVLGVDYAIDKIFRATEQHIDVQNLIDCGKILKSPSSSVLTVGLIAVAKLLSPSHSAHSVSLYNQYMDWMTVNDVEDTRSFKGFVSNRFGRIAELAKEFLKRRDSICKFFDEIVDCNANKLVLAVNTFLQNEWFICCCEVYSLMADIIIFPILDLLGIDNRNPKCSDRNWAGVKSFFLEKISKLKTLCGNFSKTKTGKGKLIGTVLSEVIETVNRQLAEMDYFDSEIDFDEIDEHKLKFAPLTNLGCESEFGKLDNRLRVSGGMTSINTHSNKNIVATNKMLNSVGFVNSSEADRRAKWKWARQSEEVKRAKQLHRDFLETVKATTHLALKQKEELKKKKVQKTINLLETCAKHGGPVTPSKLLLLERLSEKELLAEISYLRSTVAPDIRQKRRIKTDSEKFRFETFSKRELIESIRGVIQPENKVVKNNIDWLLRKAFD